MQPRNDTSDNLPLADIYFAKVIGREKIENKPPQEGSKLGHTRRMAFMCWHSWSSGHTWLRHTWIICYDFEVMVFKWQDSEKKESGRKKNSTMENGISDVMDNYRN